MADTQNCSTVFYHNCTPVLRNIRSAIYLQEQALK